MLIWAQGNHDDLPTVLKALTGVYGAWINTDSFTIGEDKETYLGLRIFELAQLAGTVRHYIWSNLDYALKVTFQIFARTFNSLLIRRNAETRLRPQVRDIPLQRQGPRRRLAQGTALCRERQ